MYKKSLFILLFTGSFFCLGKSASLSSAVTLGSDYKENHEIRLRYSVNNYFFLQVSAIKFDQHMNLNPLGPKGKSQGSAAAMGVGFQYSLFDNVHTYAAIEAVNWDNSLPQNEISNPEERRYYGDENLDWHSESINKRISIGVRYEFEMIPIALFLEQSNSEIEPIGTGTGSLGGQTFGISLTF